MGKVTFIVVGAGNRGANYAQYVKEYPAEGEAVAVYDPLDVMRNRLGDEHDIPEDRRFRDWRELLDKPKLADAVLICTQDSMHRDPAVALALMGYHILLEKPMAPTPEACRDILRAVTENGVTLAVCHVLRYTSFNRKIKELLDSGIIGRARSIQLLEPVGYWHQAHSFVRGNWRNEAESSFMLLAKSCHDLDLLNYFVPSKCTKVSSFGSLSFFTRANQPKGAADRCFECPKNIESQCPYSALKIYLRDRGDRLDIWPVSVLTPDTTEQGVTEALRKGPYGRCVFACDNDVVDHQVVNLEFEDGATASFTMSAFNPAGERQILVMGDRGTLRCGGEDIQHFDFLTDSEQTIPAHDGAEIVQSAHGGGDYGLMRDFLAAVRENDPSRITSGPEVSLESHMVVFAAEKARRNGTVEFL